MNHRWVTGSWLSLEIPALERSSLLPGSVRQGAYRPLDAVLASRFHQSGRGRSGE